MDRRQTARGRFRWMAAMRLALAALLLGASCGREGSAPPTAPTGPPPLAAHHDVAVLELEGRGEVRIELLHEWAPIAVETFIKRAESGFYDGTTFHRVLRGVLVQGGCPNTRDRDPRNDGAYLALDQLFEDEIVGATHARGTVSMANTGRKDTNGSQFFILVHERPDLDGKHTIFGRVTQGLELLDAVAQVETDLYGRYGPRDRPLEDVRVTRVRIEHPSDAVDAPDPAASPAEDGEA